MEFYKTNIQIDKKVIDDVFKEITTNPKTKMLVFGLGHDSKMWYEATNKNTFFVEDKDEYINLNKISIPSDHIIKYTYNTVVPTSMNLTDADLQNFTIPEQLQKEGPFDIIIIDGPEGWNGRPGRIIPSFWARSLSKEGTLIYVDDSVRPFEDLCIKRFFRDYTKQVFEERNKCTKIYVNKGQMKIGLAIPSSYKHLQKVIQLLQSLEQQTRRPDEVVVSMSSCPEDKEGFQFNINPLSFPVKVLTTSVKQTAGKNRNIAASQLRTDIISFFDADDVIHPQRFQALEEAFNKGADVVLHNFNNTQTDQHKPFIYYPYFVMTANKLVKAPSGCAKMSTDFRIPLHQSQVTVRRWVLEKVTFIEEPRSGTDAIFCGAVCALPGITSQYIANPLSHYYPSNTFGIN